jgi:hypothetical protein
MNNKKYKFIKWVSKKSIYGKNKWANTFSIAILPVFEKIEDKKIVFGATTYRISEINAFSENEMIELAKYLVDRANECQDSETVSKDMFKLWRKDWKIKKEKQEA